MKTVFSFLLVLFVVVACSKDNNKSNGVCYCDFANGEQQEYDLRHLSEKEQIDTCFNHHNNAGHFGGVCKLEQ